MSRFGASLSVVGLGLIVTAGCQVVPRRTPGALSGPATKFDSGVVRTQFEKSESPVAEPGPAAPVVEAKVSAEQRIGVHLDLGRVLESQGRAEDALGEYRKAIDAYREAGNSVRGDGATKARLHRKLAQAFDHLGQPEEAKAHYQAAQKLAPRDPNVWNDAGYSAFFRGRFDEAERLLKKAASLDPANPRILSNLGMTLAAEGRTDAALEVLTKAGGPASARMNLAYVLASTGRSDEAREQYRAALAIDPGLKVARDALAKLGPGAPTRVARGGEAAVPEPSR
jgi:tetratricopeptide (TPR) repeat protein